MSLRRLPVSLPDRVAALEEFVRRLQGDFTVNPIDTRYLYNARGDILIAIGPDEPEPLHTPSAIPGIPGVVVPRYNPGRPLSIEWALIHDVTATSLS